MRALGHVDDALLPGLYAGAAAFVLPSLYEGFGLTALEALAAGVPVVAADRGALPEVCGDAALLVDPLDAEAVAAALERVLDDPAPWRAAGPPRAAPLTWAATAAGVDATMDARPRMISARVLSLQVGRAGTLAVARQPGRHRDRQGPGRRPARASR